MRHCLEKTVDIPKHEPAMLHMVVFYHNIMQSRGLVVQAFDDNSKGYDMLGYTRVHRDAAIVAAMREWMHIA